MIEIVIENQGVNEILPMVTSMRDRGWKFTKKRLCKNNIRTFRS